MAGDLVEQTATGQAPEKIGKYEILGEVGRGAMGVVYLGHDPFVDRKVAVKVCSAEGGDGDETARLARKMFVNEAQSAGNLDHPNILKVYDAGEDNGEPYIVMEYLDGAETLRVHCDSDHLLPVDTVITTVKKCAEALDYAHRCGVTHRDIKPANIMLTRNGDVKIVDFGVAQRTQTDRTQVLGVFGSPRYMSPEQARDENVTTQADLFSLGVLCYELLTGVAPFEAKGISGLIYKILHEEPAALREKRPDLPEGLQQVINRALAKKVADRYHTGAEMAADLAAVLERVNTSPSELSQEERLELLRAVPFFEDFSDSDVEEVMDVGVWEDYRSGQQLCGEGEVEEGFFLIVSGEVSVQKAGKRIGVLRAGECFGEMGYLTNAERSASVVAASPVCVLRVTDALTDWASLPCQMRFSKAFQRILIERLAHTSGQLSERLD